MIPLFLVLHLWCHHAEAFDLLLEQEAHIGVLQKNVHGVMLKIADNTGTAISKGATGSSMLQTKCATKSTQLTLCSNTHDSVWKDVCGHWAQLLAGDIIEKGSGVCCSAIPAACRGPSTCDKEDTCWVPTCRQERWYLNNVESLMESTLRANGVDALPCIFATASQGCIEVFEDETNVVVQPQLFRDYLVGEEFLSSEAAEVEAIKKELGASLVSAEARVWHSEPVNKIEWKVKTLTDDKYARFGAEHSFLVVHANGKQYLVEQGAPTGPFDVSISTRTKPGELFEVALSNDLRLGLTVADLIRHFPGGLKYDVVTNNCHQAVQKVFSYAAPAIQEKALPNAGQVAMIQAIRAVSPPQVTALGTP